MTKDSGKKAVRKIVSLTNGIESQGIEDESLKQLLLDAQQQEDMMLDSMRNVADKLNLPSLNIFVDIYEENRHNLSILTENEDKLIERIKTRIPDKYEIPTLKRGLDFLIAQNNGLERRLEASKQTNEQITHSEDSRVQAELKRLKSIPSVVDQFVNTLPKIFGPEGYKFMFPQHKGKVMAVLTDFTAGQDYNIVSNNGDFKIEVMNHDLALSLYDKLLPEILNVAWDFAKQADEIERATDSVSHQISGKGITREQFKKILDKERGKAEGARMQDGKNFDDVSTMSHEELIAAYQLAVKASEDSNETVSRVRERQGKLSDAIRQLVQTTKSPFNEIIRRLGNEGVIDPAILSEIDYSNSPVALGYLLDTMNPIAQATHDLIVRLEETEKENTHIKDMTDVQFKIVDDLRNEIVSRDIENKNLQVQIDNLRDAESIQLDPVKIVVVSEATFNIKERYDSVSKIVQSYLDKHPEIEGIRFDKLLEVSLHEEDAFQKLVSNYNILLSDIKKIATTRFFSANVVANINKLQEEHEETIDEILASNTVLLTTLVQKSNIETKEEILERLEDSNKPITSNEFMGTQLYTVFIGHINKCSISIDEIENTPDLDCVRVEFMSKFHGRYKSLTGKLAEHLENLNKEKTSAKQKEKIRSMIYKNPENAKVQDDYKQHTKLVSELKSEESGNTIIKRRKKCFDEYCKDSKKYLIPGIKNYEKFTEWIGENKQKLDLINSGTETKYILKAQAETIASEIDQDQASFAFLETYVKENNLQKLQGEFKYFLALNDILDKGFETPRELLETLDIESNLIRL